MGKSKDLATGETRFVNTAGDTMTGNLGVKATLKTTHADADVVQFGGTGYLANWEDAEVYLSENMYQDTSGAYKYLTASHASLYSQTTGKHQFRVAGSGSADAAITFNTALEIDNDGHITKPNQSAFLSDMQGITQDNLGGSVSTTIQFGNEVFDQNADYNTSTYTFTAPVTGRYMLGSNLNYSQWDVSGNYVWMVIVTSNNTWYLDLKNANVITADGYYGQQGCVLADMDANDTAYVAVASSGMANQMDMITGTSSQFFGYLVA